MLKSCDSGINNDCFSYSSKYQHHIPCSFAYKFSKDVILYRGKNAVFKLIQCILREYSYCKSVIKKHFNKRLVMTAEQNEEFQRTNICWICGKLVDIGDNKVRDHCHISNNAEDLVIGVVIST